MIIQCRKCETRFRFDETLMEGDGVWVRCSRCQHVFFEEQSAGEGQTTVSPAPEIPSVRISDAKRVTDDRFPPAEERPMAAGSGKTEESSLLEEIEREIPAEIEREVTIGEIDADVAKETPSAVAAPEEAEEELPEAEPSRRGWGRTLLKIFALIILTVLIAAGGSLWLLPDLRNQALDAVSPWLQDVPGIEKLLGTEPKGPGGTLAPVHLKEVRQRSVTNLLMGTLRVVEGVAVNQSPYPLANIRIRLVISDAYDVVLGERNVYCGNLLTDGELNTLAEAEIQRELSTPGGTDVSNQRIPPNGSIPFMIVFSQEKAGAIKTVIMPAGADRVQ